MPPSAPRPVTKLLDAIGQGDSSALERLWKLIYDELHGMAQRQMADESPGRILQPTALVHEAYFRLFGNGDRQWENRRHFFTAAAKTMRLIRIDDARNRNRLKRGGGQQPVSIEEHDLVFNQDPIEMLAVDEALKRLEQHDPRKAQVVTLRYFVGLSIDETAEALELSPKTVDNDWRVARAWLHRELSKGDTTTH